MKNKSIVLIAAHDQNRVIGLNGKMPWHFPKDLKHFKEITINHAVIMGRKTFEAIGKPLKDRQNIILTRNPDYFQEGCIICHTLKEAFETIQDETLFIIGGQELFQQTIKLADILYMTEIDETFEGDAFFPEFDKNKYTETVLKTTEIPYHAKFKVYRRK